MKLLLFFIILVIIAVGLLIIMAEITNAEHNPDVDEGTKAVCRLMAVQNAHDYRNTEFANRPWYQYCIDNIRYTSPLFMR